jgi:hypothetical protein
MPCNTCQSNTIIPILCTCNQCVTATGRPGTLSNVKMISNGVITDNWKTLDQIQRQIQHTVRVTQSEYSMNKATSTTDLSCTYGNWLSDRSQRHGMPTITHTRNGSSICHSKTGMRPGVSSAPTNVKGVDVKHFSYQRYLNKLKGLGPLKPATTENRVTANKGAKNVAFTIMRC